MRPTASAPENPDIARALDHLTGAMGVTVGQHSDVQDFTQASLALTGKPPSPPFDPKINAIASADLIWLSAHDHDGALVAIQALKRERITGPLTQHLDRQYHDYYCDGEDARIIGHAPLVATVSGEIAYHGDLFIAQSQRGKGLATPFAALIQLLAHQHWNPDWIWGFIEPAKVQRGYAQKIGYTQMAAQGTHYQGTPKGISTDDWFVCLSRAELQARVGVGVS
jgi:GNAT superfamily N-acetyltransferase